MRRDFNEIMQGINEKSEKGLARKRLNKKAAVYTLVSLLLVGAVCVGFIFNPFKGAVNDTQKVIENGSKEESLTPDREESTEKRYLSIKQLSANLMEGITAEGVTGKEIDDAFLSAYADFGMTMFKSLYTEGENALVSPLSIMYAFAMLSNGAEGETREQIEAVLGGMDAETLNKYLYALSAYLEGDEVNVSNSVWMKDGDGFFVNPDFLQTNANYYDADFYKAAFDDQTVEDVNNWAKEKTNGMIDKIVDKYSESIVMQLINAICFEAEWVYEADDTLELTFNNADGSETKTDFMKFKYESKYIATENAKGVIKDYKGGKYSFVALMPDEGIDINDYIASLDGKAFTSAVKNAEDADVLLWMPKFKYNCSMDLIPTLKALGMTNVFSPSLADLSGLGTSSDGNIYASYAKQDTFIEVSELGTRAAAITSVGFESSGIGKGYILDLDRPFVYAIIDTATGLPVFTGALTEL